MIAVSYSDLYRWVGMWKPKTVIHVRNTETYHKSMHGISYSTDLTFIPYGSGLKTLEPKPVKTKLNH